MDKRDAARSGRLSIRGVSKLYGRTRALDGIDLAVESGEFLSLLGPSGCGKTTLLRCVAGLVAADSGTIEVDDRPLDGVPPWKRDISVVFQSYALFPHMSVAGNVAFGLKMRGLDRKTAAARVMEALELVRMADFAARLPAQLSGGQQQRVALARAIVVRPRILLLDEPMAALDAKLRTSVQREIRQLQSKLGITTILVTHDQAEAMSMSDRIAVVNAGRIEQLAVPQVLYDRPSTPFVAEFIGEINRLRGTVEAGGGGRRFVFAGEGGALALPLGPESGDVPPGAATLMVRPEAVRIAPLLDPEPAPHVAATVEDRVQMGDRVVFYLRCGGAELKSVRLSADAAGRHDIQPGTNVRLAWDAAAAKLFPGHI